jgi:hypothetical protein
MPRQFFYNGNATGFSGRIKAPFDEVIEAQASCSLGVIGGYASARVDNFRRHEIFSFASAHTQASGILSEKSQAFETLVSSVLEGFNLVDMVKVDYMAARLMSKHPVEPPKKGPDEPTITPVGSHYGKIVVAGYEITPVIDVNFFNTVCSYNDLCDKIGRDRDLQAAFNVSGVKMPPPRGMMAGSIVREIRGGGPPLEIKGNTVRVPGFGRLYFGEYIIEQYSRRLVMLRAELGCPVQLDSSGGCVSGNGHAP